MSMMAWKACKKVDPAGNAIEKINYNLNSAQVESFDGENNIKY